MMVAVMDPARLIAWTLFVACLFWVGPRGTRSGAPSRAVAQERPAQPGRLLADEVPDAVDRKSVV